MAVVYKLEKYFNIGLGDHEFILVRMKSIKFRKRCS